jgi:hypothetical protein
MCNIIPKYYDDDDDTLHVNTIFYYILHQTGHTLRKAKGEVCRETLGWNPQGSARTGRPTHQAKTKVLKKARRRVHWQHFVDA